MPGSKQFRADMLAVLDFVRLELHYGRVQDTVLQVEKSWTFWKPPRRRVQGRNYTMIPLEPSVTQRSGDGVETSAWRRRKQPKI